MEKTCDYRKTWTEYGANPMKCIMDVSKNMRYLMERRLSETGLTSTQGRILGYIFMENRKGHDVFQRDIEELFRIRRSSVTSVLQLLEKKGLLRRESVPEDARLKKLVLTEDGRKLQQGSIHYMDTLEREIRNVFTEDELNIFFIYMNKVDEKVLNLYYGKEETDD